MAQAQKFPDGQGRAVSDTENMLEQLLGYNLKRAYIIIQEDYRIAMSEHGLSPRVFAALSLVVGNPRLTQSELARQLGIERSGLVSIVDELEGRGYLNRAAVPGDRRVQALVPTPKGIQACDAAMAQAQAHEDKVLSYLTAQEKQQLLLLLQKIRNSEKG